MRFLKVLCIIAMVLAVSTIAYAETQSVKVSGDIAVRSFVRGAYNLDKTVAADVGTDMLDTRSNSWDTFLQSTAEVEIAADLTDNVAGVIRLVNQRVWGDGNYANGTDAQGDYLGVTGMPFMDQVTHRGVNGAGVDSFDVDLDLAYIELKEFLYSPLTLKIGRQDLWFGKGFIVGAQLQDNNSALFAPEYTAIQSFDAVRATFDYDPWTIDAVFSKIRENYMSSDDDSNLWGLNVGYVFDSYNGEAEAYYWYKQVRYNGTATLGTKADVINGADSNDVHTLGLRGSFDPFENWTLGLEGAYQLGEYVGADGQINERKRSAWAIDASAECRYWQDDFAWKPVIGAEYIFYSGEENLGYQSATTQGTYHGWDPIFRGKFDTAIREFQNVYYMTAQAGTPSTTNQHQVLVTGSVQPTDSLKLDLTYGHFWLAEDWADATVGAVAENTKRNVGDEVDINVTWDYTEDVTFGLLTAMFFPGDYFGSGRDDMATDVVGSVKLSF